MWLVVVVWLISCPWSRAELVDGGGEHTPEWASGTPQLGASRESLAPVGRVSRAYKRAPLPVKNDDSLLQGCRAAEIQGMACLTRGLLQVNAV